MNLAGNITSLPGIGSIVAQKFSNLDIYTVFDLLYHLPSRYEDRTIITPVSQIKVDDTVTVIGTIDKIQNVFTKNGKRLQLATLADSSGKISVLWFNQMYLAKSIPPNSEVSLYGKIAFYNKKPALFSPDYELIANNLPAGRQGHEPYATGRIIPIYPETAGLTSKFIRKKIFDLIGQIPEEILPQTPAGLPGWKQAISNIHFPKSLDQVEPARKRLAFDELLLIQLGNLQSKAQRQSQKVKYKFDFSDLEIQKFVQSLPFTLTNTQKESVVEILEDLQKVVPANRLLQGDVGSGKTVVAAIASLSAHLSGLKTIFLAPTQILAQQHYQTLTDLFKNIDLKIDLVTSNHKLNTEHRTPNILVGTHALLSESIILEKVGLIVIDEQHKFGVIQRQQLIKKGDSPHVLTMTATPIPRTVALTLLCDLNVSTLDALPSGRLPVKTWVVPEIKRDPAYKWISQQLKTNHQQAFIVCPLIEESETLTSIKSVKKHYEDLQKIFPDLKLGLLHGRLKPKEKDTVLEEFRNYKLDILVTTPVVEVGIDIPNATIMLIESSQRFGLAQLHQLRGRVGRSDKQSYCLLFAESQTQRLAAMQTHHSGLELANIDLKIRGIGDIYGTAQHGRKLNLKIAGLTDLDLIEQSKRASENLFLSLKDLPLLSELLPQDKISAT
ncbi:MAG: ATP-dependent DNA helicase RecG [Candidatus Amesbacteria bacterium GW2011_GWA2_42_12]|uniref:ATP-dependent DNA helicase RecG n=1 Tax=Candidatus Amesbacteria bacterium GW2011_GWA2_42_12 TaxID=1618356 RepID=A0A0G0Y735_9BACT|nr:MAG: ATP-dependent DNA helicase RecG [Candidatus Amesbacteria bacterium GW2011_GWA2_42_12]